MSTVRHVHGEEWGLFPWLAKDGLEEIHPDDRRFTSLNPFYGHLFKVLYGDGEYLALEGATGRFRVKPRLFRQVGRPQFDFAAEVRTLPPNSPKQGRVREIKWHHKEQREFYFIQVEGKKVPKRYWPEELETATK